MHVNKIKENAITPVPRAETHEWGTPEGKTNAPPRSPSISTHGRLRYTRKERFPGAYLGRNKGQTNGTRLPTRGLIWQLPALAATGSQPWDVVTIKYQH